MEGFTRRRLSPHMDDKIEPHHYARKGHSTTDALLYMLQVFYETVDNGKAGTRIFLADFSKGFDCVDLVILIKELDRLEAQVHPAVLTWIAAFLTNQKQAVRIGGTLND